MDSSHSNIKLFLNEQVKLQRLFQIVFSVGLCAFLVISYFIFRDFTITGFSIWPILGLCTLPFVYFIFKSTRFIKTIKMDLESPNLITQSSELVRMRHVSIEDNNSEYYLLKFKNGKKVRAKMPLPTHIQKGKYYALVCFSNSGICLELKSDTGKTILDSTKILHDRN
ncbi:hypothetical protein SAMN06298216_0744 [Spirosomataceae bacterium TFI 002]|nr:hypothetical protein SAMN06298216_0744 [Spirosomataceae bacterium TFI 002]